MKNLEMIKKEIDEKIQNTIEALALESIANMIRKFRLYGINHEIELCFSIIPIRPEDIITYEHHFDKNCKAHLYYKNAVIDVKEELSAIEEKKQLEDSLKQDSVKNSPIKI
jgi:hypothetical protein